jgi:hypothetical protein
MKNKFTLEKDGFQVFKSEIIKSHVLSMTQDLEFLARYMEPEDVFRTDSGDIKQIQNLDFGILNEMLVALIDPIAEFDLLNNQYFCKPPDYKMTSPHQDNAYFDSDEKIYTFWIPLQDVNEKNSCMFYVPGSHKEGLVEHKPIGTNTRTRTGKTGVSLYSGVYNLDEFVSIPMKAGDILCHDKNCMHFSSPNLTDKYRIAITAIVKLK